MAAQSWFDEVRIATTGNIPLRGLGAVDGVTPVANDRILVKDQTTASQNGIYVAASRSWSRATDFATTSTVTPEAAVRVSEGTVNAHSEWYLSTQGTITVGTTSLTFALLRPNAGWKDYVRAATSGSNVTLSGTQTIDGVVLAVGDRVLVKDQTIGSQNGIYLVASAAWSHAVDGAYSPLVLPETTIRV